MRMENSEKPTLRLIHICEVCGRTEILTPEEACNAGWAYPPLMGHFGVVSPRTCPNCRMVDTAWAALILDKKGLADLSPRQIDALNRILGEPESILPDDEQIIVVKEDSL